jgi:GTPase SAR1 family protein
MIPIPKELLNLAMWLDSIIGAFKAWRGFRILVFGTDQVGKTTLWTALEKGKAVQSSEIEKTQSTQKVTGGKGEFRLRNVRMARIGCLESGQARPFFETLIQKFIRQHFKGCFD